MRGHPRANGSASRWKKLSTYTQARSPPPRTPPPLPPPDLDEEGRVDNQRNTPRNTLPSPSNGSGPPQSSASDRIRLRSRDGWKGKSKPSSVFIVVSRAVRDAYRRRRPSRAVCSALSSCSSISRAEISPFSSRRTRPSSNSRAWASVRRYLRSVFGSPVTKWIRTGGGTASAPNRHDPGNRLSTGWVSTILPT